MTAAVNQPTDADVLLSVADMLRNEMREHAVWCGTCGRRHIRGDMPGSFVDVNPDAIPADKPAAHDRVMGFIAQAPAHRFGDGLVRILLPDPGRAVSVASHLQTIGVPAHAIHLGGY